MRPVAAARTATTSRANTNEASKTAQYAYYANGNSKIKYKHDDTGSASYWWLRSPHPGYARYARLVDTSGAQNSGHACVGRGAAAACVIG
jgi:hypothetical protein